MASQGQYGGRKVREGTVVSDKMQKTVVVAVQANVRHPLYKKTVRRVRHFVAHDEGEAAQMGDRVRIVESRPLSRTKRWRVIDVLERAELPEVEAASIGLELLGEVKAEEPVAVAEEPPVEAEAAAQPEAVAVAEAAPESEPEAAAEAAPELAAEPEAAVAEAEAAAEDAEPAADPEPEAAADAEAAPESEPEPAAEAAPEPAAEPEAAAVAEAAPESEPEPKAAADAEAEVAGGEEEAKE